MKERGAPPTFVKTPKEQSYDDSQVQIVKLFVWCVSQFDEFSGFSGENLFAGMSYDKEDEEADLIYDVCIHIIDSFLLFFFRKNV